MILSAELLPFPRVAKAKIGPIDIARKALAALALALIFYVAATSLLIAVYRFVDPSATVLMIYRKYGYGWELKPPRPVALKRIPPYIRSMLIAAEDGKFYDHFGLDFEAFARARRVNAAIGKPVYGGSTLTMQVARTLFLVPEKSYLRKCLEVVAALELEILLPKNRILELYFGYAEWGKGVFGIEAAARRWFGVGASALSREQAARLVALLSSPIVYRPDNLERSGILRDRYTYLARRFITPRLEKAAPGAAAVGPEPPATDAMPATGTEAPPLDAPPGDASPPPSAAS
ncbi:MAG: transglycosylase domain-containing protein, partial [Spirochaetaceae bacterium]|nr:transglycosylase domain-containing protein [Spirochaetaceae bacterium]